MNKLYEHQACPGSYNLSSSISAKSFIYSNLPRATMSQGPKHPKMYLPVTGKMIQNLEDGPSAHSYNPNYQFLWSKGSYPVIDKTKRADYFLSMSQRSPGPVYDPKKLSSTAVPFPRAGLQTNGSNSKSMSSMKQTRSQMMDTRKLFNLKDSVPGPGAYQVKEMSRKSSVTFNKTGRDLDVRACMKYLDRKTKDYFASY